MEVINRFIINEIVIYSEQSIFVLALPVSYISEYSGTCRNGSLDIYFGTAWFVTIIIVL